MKKVLCILLALVTMASTTACSSSNRVPQSSKELENPAAGTVSLQNFRERETFLAPGENPPAADEPLLEELTAPQTPAPAQKPADKAPTTLTPDAVAPVENVPFTEKVVTPSVEGSSTKAQVEEVRAVWISYLDFNTLLKGKTEAQFRQNIRTAFQNVVGMNLNTVLVQVRPYGDALYPSDYFPWSHTVTGTEGKNPGFDPLAIMIEEADAQDLRIEAWLNPYRIRTGGNNPLSGDNQAGKWLSQGSDAVVEYKNGIYYNPGSKDAQQLIVNGVKELVANYDLDGIHFDDYFYPTTDAAFDASTYAAYQKAGGKLGLADWRRENVNALVKEVYKTIKAADSQVLFGISPQGNMENNYNAMYIDVKKWLSTPGYVDYICPQIYFGFDNSGYPYAKTVAMWDELVKLDNIKLYIGLAPYKIGTEDTWAGNGKTEWLQSEDMIERMVSQARDADNYQGFALFRYDSVFRPAAAVSAQVTVEMDNLQAILG